MSTCKRTQGFAQNLNPLYALAGQRGHTGVDDTCGYGSKVYSLKHGRVYKILDANRPARDGSGYWAIFLICQEPDGRYFEWQIGHMSKFYVNVGDVVEPWQFLGEEGNRGGVYQGGIQITRGMQDAGDTRGSHRHYNKKYLTRIHESQYDTAQGQFLTAYNPLTVEAYKDSENYLYIVDNHRNGYNGSVDCAKDVDEGRLFVENYFKNPPPSVVPPPLQDTETLKKTLTAQVLSLISQVLQKLRAEVNRLSNNKV